MPAERTRLGGTAWSALAVCLIGTGAAVYLTVEHFTGSKSFACPATSSINCQKVTTSQWSHMFGVPVAVIGLAYFVVLLALCTPWLWRDPRLNGLRVAGAAVGVLTALYLVWIELFRIDAICIWCTVVHVCSVALLAITLWQFVAEQPA
ncbi:MAG: vitamin K epoxide reductase family protein [Jatrophihabitans sp.]